MKITLNINNHSSEEIHEILFSKAEYREAVRLVSCYLVSKGKSSRSIEELLGISFKQVTTWVHEFNKSGIEGLKEKEKTGRKSGLSNEQKVLLKNILENSNPIENNIDEKKWTGKAIGKLISYKFNISYKRAQIYNIINSLRIVIEK